MFSVAIVLISQRNYILISRNTVICKIVKKLSPPGSSLLKFAVVMLYEKPVQGLNDKEP